LVVREVFYKCFYEKEVNMKSSTMIGGKSDQYSRNKADFYATPPECTIALLNRFEWLFRGGLIWEPACGDGAISKVLEDKGFTVRSTDLYDRGYGEAGVDFLTENRSCSSIITNPPFNLSEDFIKKARTFHMPFAILTKATYWHAARRYDLFRRSKPMAVIAMTWRPAMSPERGQSATMDFIWTVWGAGPQKNTQYFIEKRPEI
jgi:hypothetical protein